MFFVYIKTSLIRPLSIVLEPVVSLPIESYLSNVTALVLECRLSVVSPALVLCSK